MGGTPGSEVTWRSLDTHIATVDSEGLVIGVRRGEVLISVKCNICPNGFGAAPATSGLDPGRLADEIVSGYMRRENRTDVMGPRRAARWSIGTLPLTIAAKGRVSRTYGHRSTYGCNTILGCSTVPGLSLRAGFLAPSIRMQAGGLRRKTSYT